MVHLACRLAPWSLLVAVFWSPAALPAEEAQKKPVIVEVTVPPGAEVYIDGEKTKSTGPKRRYESPPVAPPEKGHVLVYTVKAVWKGADGKEVVRQAKVQVTPGKTAFVDLTKEEPKIASLKLEVPGTFAVDAGAKKTLTVKVKRENVKGPVKVTFAGLPAGIKTPELTIAADKSEGSVEIAPAMDAKGGTSTVKVAAAAAGTRAAPAEIKLTVKAAPPPKESLTIEKLAPLDVTAGDKKPLTIKIKRDNVTGPVQVTFAKLPAKEVKIPALTIPADKSEGQAEVSVEKGAKEGTIDVTIQASSGDVKAQTDLKLNVKAAAKP